MLKYLYMADINWEFSFGWFMCGLAILIAGGLAVIFYRQIAENLANGVSSYDKVKLFGVIGCVIGLLIMANLHTFVLTLLTNLIFRR